jgi:exopolysaccharide biosynthesis polyprenyl glycosylphosphotransferase
MTAIIGSTSSVPIAAPRIAGDVPRTLITPRITPALGQRLEWQRRYRARLALSDAVVVLSSAGIAAWIQIDNVARVDLAEAPWLYGRVFVATVVIWSLMLVFFQTRDARVIGQGTTEYRRVAHATGLAFGILAIGFVLLQSQGIRMQLLVALPLGMAGMLIGRWTCRQWLIRQRRIGEFVSRAIVVGKREDVEYVVRSVHQDSLVGYHIVGVTLTDGTEESFTVGDRSFTSVGTADTAAAVASQLRADAVIIASMPSDSDYLKRLSWQLEGTASELVLSSPLVDVAGPRMTLRPVEGLPLIQVQIPTFEGSRYVLKRAVDIVLALGALTVVGLITPVIALAIKLDSPGTVFFRQTRVGRDGAEFQMVKFRSMCSDAEERRSELIDRNEGSGPLFKMRSDPRVTKVGALLRKYSLDELPQFWNVLMGDMSIVGPRPPLPSETLSYGSSTYRRLFIRPGITGPWQVGGRSALTWEESLRLDLRYVENWSLTEDLLIMARTGREMIRPSAAY